MCLVSLSTPLAFKRRKQKPKGKSQEGGLTIYYPHCEGHVAVAWRTSELSVSCPGGLSLTASPLGAEQGQVHYVDFIESLVFCGWCRSLLLPCRDQASSLLLQRRMGEGGRAGGGRGAGPHLCRGGQRDASTSCTDRPPILPGQPHLAFLFQGYQRQPPSL